MQWSLAAGRGTALGDELDGVNGSWSHTGEFTSLATCNVILQGEDLATPPAA